MSHIIVNLSCDTVSLAEGSHSYFVILSLCKAFVSLREQNVLLFHLVTELCDFLKILLEA